MHTSRSFLLATSAALASVFSPAFAETDGGNTPGSTLTANVALTSNYKFRGQDQDQIGRQGVYKSSAIKPAIQGGLDYTHASGVYVGSWNASVDWLAGNSIESDLYAGYRFKAAPFDLDVGAITYLYPGNSAGNTTELYAGVGWSSEAVGAFTLKYAHTVSKDYFGYAGAKSGSGLQGRNTGYLNLAYSKEIVPRLTLKAAVGYTHMRSDIRSLGYRSYLDYSVGASYDFGGGLALAGAVQGANRESSYLLATGGNNTQSINKPRLVLTLAKSF